MKIASVFLGFAPWIIFSVVAGPSTWTWAALAALVATAIIAVPAMVTTRQVNILDVAGLVFFGALVVLALFLDRADLQILENRAQLLSSIVLASVAYGSVALGRPFTEFYAKQQTPREYWRSPLFRRINRVLTLIWGTAFAINALCDVAVAAGASTDVFNWVIPAVVLVAAYKFTVWYPDHAGEADDRARSGAEQQV